MVRKVVTAAHRISANICDRMSNDQQIIEDAFERIRSLLMIVV